MAPPPNLTLFGPDDIRLRRTQIDEGLAPSERRLADHARLNALLGLAEALVCRRQTLLGYFGEQAEPVANAIYVIPRPRFSTAPPLSAWPCPRSCGPRNGSVPAI